MMANVLYALNDGHRNINNVVGRPFDSYTKAIEWGRSQLGDSPFVVADGPRQYLVDGDDLWELSLSQSPFMPLQMKGKHDAIDPAPRRVWPSREALRKLLDDHKAGRIHVDPSFTCKKVRSG